MTQYSVAVLAKGAAISCELRLALSHLAAFETYVPGDTQY